MFRQTRLSNRFGAFARKFEACRVVWEKLDSKGCSGIVSGRRGAPGRAAGLPAGLGTSAGGGGDCA